MKARFWWLLGLMLVAFGIAKAPSMTPAAAESDVTITLHKRIYRDARLKDVDKWQYDNQGQEITLGDESFGLNGAHFTVYDATSLFAQAGQPGESEKDFATRMSKMARKEVQALVAKYQLQPAGNTAGAVGQLTTQTVAQEAGVATVTVPTKVAGQNAKYLIVETGVDAEVALNVDVTKLAGPIYVSLPLVVGGEALEDIHVYPKNIGYVRDPYFFKFGVTLAGEHVRLQGAVFALYELQNGVKRYLSLSPVNDLQNEWIESADPLHDPQVNLFISDQNGLVNTGERFLPKGTYYFEELQSVPGYLNNLADQPVKVEVPASWYDEEGNFLPVLVNGEVMDETLSGVVQEATITKGRPRVYNYQKQTPGENKPEPGKPGGGGSQDVLPSLGDVATWMAVILGLALIFAAWLLVWRRKHRNVS
ncbi:pilin N-terminal domain-containing protein [Lacticaseibacillus baoqingensis]|uniref:Pilin N-terminal domain-containing protein n=1 Tax=Lacticaseibacillus baoqingensis TaxID=2486013 RepID=A0ABW4E583_9LACO|nr:pilin N-terminal domain-containing protein [Lacticaseibacillus baoqingensis]